MTDVFVVHSFYGPVWRLSNVSQISMTFLGAGNVRSLPVPTRTQSNGASINSQGNR